jgi:hypothetical protein
MDNKMTELSPSEEKDAVKEIIDGINAGSKRLEIVPERVRSKN